MPWNLETLKIVQDCLRESAAEGNFVPGTWIDDVVPDDDGGYRVFGCGFGLVGWFTALSEGGIDYANKMLPVGSMQCHVNVVLKNAGLTDHDIFLLDVKDTWEHFDDEISGVYKNRQNDWEAYIDKSKDMADFFIEVISRVPVEDAEFSFPVPPAKPKEAKLPGFLKNPGVSKVKTLVLTEAMRVADAGPELAEVA